MTTKLSDTAAPIVSELLLGEHYYLSEDESSLTLWCLERRRMRRQGWALRQGRAKKRRSVRTLCFDYGAAFLFLSAFNILSQSTTGTLDQSGRLLLLSNVLVALVSGWAVARIHVKCRRLGMSNGLVGQPNIVATQTYELRRSHRMAADPQSGGR